MLYWPVLICSALMFGAYMAATPLPDGTALSAEDARHVFVTVGALCITIGAALRLLLSADRGGSGFACGAMVATLVAVAVTGPSAQGEIGRGFDRVRGAFVPSYAFSARPGHVELRRARDGHYRADARINGHPVRMMVDTGASMIVLPYEEAAALGIDPALLQFTMPVVTANGPSSVAPVRLGVVEVGSIRVEDVEAAIARPGRIDMPLLGMSFLERLTETSFRGDRLILLKENARGGDGYFTSAPVVR